VGHSYGAQWGAILRVKAAVLVGGVATAESLFQEEHVFEAASLGLSRATDRHR